jgi:hypothetical protein
MLPPLVTAVPLISALVIVPMGLLAQPAAVPKTHAPIAETRVDPVGSPPMSKVLAVEPPAI